MTKILPTEGESAEIGHRAVAAFHAQKPDGWRPSDLSGDADAGYDSFVQVVAHAQYMEAFHAQFKGSTVSAYSADKSFVRVVPTARYVLLPLANLLTGYSVKAMERKIERGDWQEGKVWRRAPDGHIVIDVLGYQRWVEGPRAAVTSPSRGLEGKIMQLPMQMDLALRREKE